MFQVIVLQFSSRWSDKNGQDDLTWYHADKQSDGSYKVHVDTASHKGDAGTYSVHLYYMLDGKRTYITETKGKGMGD